ncbi:MAG: hypothetical protein IBJ14_12890 [Hydrogenophaga sp.]|nr:hypothetical protein [Hydrogenophaga sp.]
MERLVVCQGTAQLVTAVSALRAHAKRAGTKADETPSRDHLLICGLAVPEGQADEFARVIERMAALLHPFASISRLDDGALEQLIDSAQRGAGAREVAGRLQKVTGVEKVDEVFTVRDWQACNELALGAYPEATHVCYGDSVGVYLPRGFMSPRRSPWSRVAARLRQWGQARQGLLDNPRVDINYLLLPGAFGMPPGGEVVRTQATTLRDLFGSLASLLDGPALEEIRQRTAGRSVWVLLGSNFSEQGLMTPESEASAYRDWIEGLQPEPGAVLLIKSHPRDDRGKRPLLEKQLLGLFDEVWCADSVGSAYLPVEVLLLELVSVVDSLRCLTVSTACLGTHFVVESKTDIGFGEALVARYMAPDRQQQRLRHERDLRRLCVA